MACIYMSVCVLRGEKFVMHLLLMLMWYKKLTSSAVGLLSPWIILEASKFVLSVAGTLRRYQTIVVLISFSLIHFNHLLH